MMMMILIIIIINIVVVVVVVRHDGVKQRRDGCENAVSDNAQRHSCPELIPDCYASDYF